MSTILFNEIVFGPIKSRRLGNSLGVNLSPKYGKVCSFDCIYCECGWNKDGKKDSKLPSFNEVEDELVSKLTKFKADGISIDTITFSGNGEPTLHPKFPEIIALTIKLRNELFPNANVSVLSNATQIHKKAVKEALLSIDNAILKIDSALDSLVTIIDKPYRSYSLKKTIETLKEFNGNFILQTIFFKGNYKGTIIDCTSKENVESWRKLARYLNPKSIMIYTIDRETPALGLQKASIEEMRIIAQPLIDEGFEVQISG